HLVAKEKIAESGDYNLSGDRYIEAVNFVNQKYPIVELKDVCVVDWGNTELTKKSYIENGEYLGVSAAGCDGRMKHFEHEVGTVVLSAIGANCGRVFYPNEKFTAIKNTITFTPDRKKLYLKFLFYILKDNTFPKRGGGQPFMTKGDVKKYKIPLPPIEVQKEIVEQVEVKQKAISAAKAVIDNLERERRYFGQAIRKIKDVEWVELGKLFEKVNEQINPQSKTGSTIYIGLENIESNSGNLVGNINAEMKAIKSTKNVFKKDDILYGKLRPNLNKVWLADKDGICSTDILVLRGGKKIIPAFYLPVLLSSDFNLEVLKGLKGAQLPRVSFDYLKHLKIPLLSLEVQKQLVAEMEEQEKIIEANKKLVGIMEQKITEVLSEV
ncbi:MAG: hypothetical protein COY63_02115, partial [Candidatus Huberarchaeum crystalense]